MRALKQKLGVKVYSSLRSAFDDIGANLKKYHSEVFQRMPKENDDDKRNGRNGTRRNKT